MGTVSAGRKLDRFLTNLSALVEALPSPEAIDRLDADLGALIEFLQNFRNRLNLLPTDQGAEQIASTIETVRDFVRVAEADPTMCRVLGLYEQSRPNARPTRQAKPSGLNVAMTIEKLQQLSPEMMEQALSDRATYNVQILRAIALQLGLKIPSRATRLSIAEKITKTLVNRRGYHYLREGTHDGEPFGKNEAGL